jgi:hypothetical protein
LAHLAREPVDAIDEQQIDLALARQFQCVGKPGAVELRSG